MEEILKLDEKELSKAFKQEKRVLRGSHGARCEIKAIIRLQPSEKEYWIVTSGAEDSIKLNNFR